jgi:hypothetical protein
VQFVMQCARTSCVAGDRAERRARCMPHAVSVARSSCESRPCAALQRSRRLQRDVSLRVALRSHHMHIARTSSKSGPRSAKMRRARLVSATSPMLLSIHALYRNR